MREILFKAKRIDNGEWITGYYFRANHHWHNHGIHEDWLITNAIQNGGWCNVCSKYAIDRNTLCRYTGLTDKNGNKIWENDLLMFHSNKNDLAKATYGEFFVVNMENLERIDSVIGWHYEVIETDAISKCEPFNIPMPLTNDYIKTCELEIVGNIFDNPELMNENGGLN